MTETAEENNSRYRKSGDFRFPFVPRGRDRNNGKGVSK